MYSLADVYADATDAELELEVACRLYTAASASVHGPPQAEKHPSDDGLTQVGGRNDCALAPSVAVVSANP